MFSGADAIRGPGSEQIFHGRALISLNGYSLAGLPLSFNETNRRGSHYLDIGMDSRLNY